MKIARSKMELSVGISALAVMACVIMVPIDERLSRQLDGVDITWEEVNPKPPIGGQYQPAPTAKTSGEIQKAQGWRMVSAAAEGPSMLLRLRPGARPAMALEQGEARGEALAQPKGYRPGPERDDQQGRAVTKRKGIPLEIGLLAFDIAIWTIFLWALIHDGRKLRERARSQRPADPWPPMPGRGEGA